MEKTKKCTRCGEEKNIYLFSKDKRGKSGRYSLCKECLSKQKKEYYEKNKEKIIQNQKEYYEKNKEKIKEYQKEYYAKKMNDLKIEVNK